MILRKETSISKEWIFEITCLIIFSFIPIILWEIFIDFLFPWIRSFHKICIAKELYFFILQLFLSTFFTLTSSNKRIEIR